MQRNAGIVIEEKNLTPRILQNEILRLLDNRKLLASMSARAREFAKDDGAFEIAKILIKFSESHY
jgi:UDP-N-acetylglucosamine:LPS N-acetylglucosamine transferase